ncbi:reprolysin-like metallopeptidase [Bizionia sp.]|uniref:zinc-dependent metalloprotease n=1 Tax=Bizionia sp. TaxID=1954480 RepID=UPI003A8EEED9
MKKKLHKVLPFVILMFCLSAFSQDQHFKKVTTGQENTMMINTTYSMDINHLMSDLSKAQQRGDSREQLNNLVIEVPNLDGDLEKYLIQEASVMSPGLQAQYPEIRSYVGYGIDTPSSYLRFSVSPYKGMSGIVLSGVEGKGLVIEPVKNNVSQIIVREKQNSNSEIQSFECSTPEALNQEIGEIVNTNRTGANGTLHTFDLAMSVTAEYSIFHGGTLPQVNAAIVNTMTVVNAIFENEFNVNMVLIPNNDAVVYLTTATSPYSSTTDSGYNGVLQSTLNSVIGNANYDIGHLMGGIGNNGNAGCIGCVCVANQKGSGYTTSTNPIGVNFDVDYVAHEMGHQFGANHTFTFRSEGGIAQMEPGSGSTIMSYAGITGTSDVQPFVDPYFHAISIQQVNTHVSSRTCDVETDTGNNIPTANAGANITLPKGTPFRLTGIGSDADANDVITYCWEQFDENNGVTEFPDPTSTNSNEPQFRSYLPTTNPTRTFPKMEDLVSFGVNGSLYEQIPTVGRNADFRLTVRDNRPGGAANAFDDMRVTWSNTAGPFVVTSQGTDQIVWTPGETETITWNVAGTTANGINAANVNILLSTSLTPDTDFTTVLATNVPNNGSYQVVVPSVTSAYSRILVEAADGSFFNINDNYFAIGDYIYVPGDSCEEYFFNAGVLLDENSTQFSGFNLPISDSKTISDLKISIDATTANSGQIRAAIRPPSQASGFNQVYWGSCAGSTDLILTFDDAGNPINCADTANNDVVLPAQPLSFADGLNSLGNWVFFIGDVEVDGVRVTWNSATLTICESGIFVPELSVDEFGLDASFAVFPNPNNGDFSIKFKPSTNESISVEVFDIRGRNVYNKTYNSTGDFNESISLSNAQAGMYLLNVTQGSQKITKKLIVN